MRIIWSSSARTDTVNARRYIEQHDQGAAKRVSTAIRAAVHRLVEAPGLGHPGRVAGTRELVVPRTPYVVAYSIVTDRLVILGVIHGAQEWPDGF